MVADFLADTVDQIIAGLTAPSPVEGGSGAADNEAGRSEPAGIDTRTAEPAAIDTRTAEPAAIDTVFTGTIDEINEAFSLWGWSDGLPVVGSVRGADSLVVATGGGRNGIVLGPALGKVAADIATGEEPGIEHLFLGPDRFGA